jgi:cytochrome P450
VTAVFDPRVAAVNADPYPVFATLRDHDPVHRSEIVGGLVLTRFADVRACLTDARLSSDRITPFVRHRAGRQDAPLIETLGRTLGLWAVFTDPPKHTRLRALMNRAFTTRAVERLRPRIAEIVDELLARVRGRGEMDLIRDFAYPLPKALKGDNKGVPAAHRDIATR